MEALFCKDGGMILGWVHVSIKQAHRVYFFKCGERWCFEFVNSSFTIKKCPKITELNKSIETLSSQVDKKQFELHEKSLFLEEEKIRLKQEKEWLNQELELKKQQLEIVQAQLKQKELEMNKNPILSELTEKLRLKEKELKEKRLKELRVKTFNESQLTKEIELQKQLEIVQAQLEQNLTLSELTEELRLKNLELKSLNVEVKQAKELRLAEELKLKALNEARRTKELKLNAEIQQAEKLRLKVIEEETQQQKEEMKKHVYLPVNIECRKCINGVYGDWTVVGTLRNKLQAYEYRACSFPNEKMLNCNGFTWEIASGPIAFQYQIIHQNGKLLEYDENEFFLLKKGIDPTQKVHTLTIKCTLPQSEYKKLLRVCASNQKSSNEIVKNLLLNFLK